MGDAAFASFDEGLIASLVVDPLSETVLACDRRFERMVGESAPELVGRPLAELFSAREARLAASGAARAFEARLHRRCGDPIDVRCVVRAFDAGDAMLATLALSLRDADSHAPAPLASAFDALATPIVACDYSSAHEMLAAARPPVGAEFGQWLAARRDFARAASAAMTPLGGNRAAQALAGGELDQCHRPHAGDRGALESELEAIARGAREHRFETSCLAADGRRLDFVVEWRAAPEAARPYGEVYLTYHDITERKRIEAAIRHRAEHDSLTGLPNRDVFEDRLERAIAQARRRAAKAAVLAIDLDLFKSVNDRFGHPAGDTLLKDVSRRIGAALRASDSICRLGGDEFAVLLPNLKTGGDAAVVARKILSALDEPITIERNRVAVGVSVGIAIFPDDAMDPSMLMKRADVALYRAKAEGRRRFRFFVPSMNDEEQSRRELERRFADALDNDRLTLFYQPLRRLEDRKLQGFEALLRWRLPNGDLLRPSEFLPNLSQTQMMAPLAAWTVREAAREAARWRKIDPTIDVSVNLTDTQLRTNDLGRQIETILGETGLPASALVLEVGVSALEAASTGAARSVLRTLASLGVGFSLDDVGDDAIPLLRLRRSGFRRLKLDRKYAALLTEEEEAEAVVRAVIGCGRALGLTVTAKGVETDAQLGHLKALGCDAAQGFAFEPPVEAEVARDLLEQERRGTLLWGAERD